MSRGPYRDPATVEPGPTNLERLLARVRGRRVQRPHAPQAPDAARYDRTSMQRDAVVLSVGFVALALLIAIAGTLVFARDVGASVQGAPRALADASTADDAGVNP